MGRRHRLGYWLAVAVLLALGLLTIFSVGWSFLLVGAALVVLSPFRSRPRVFWPGLALVLGFVVGYAVVAPARCHVTPALPGEGVASGPVVCRSLAGVTYRGGPGFRPSHTPGLLTGAAAGTLAALGTWVTLRERERSPRLTTGE